MDHSSTNKKSAHAKVSGCQQAAMNKEMKKWDLYFQRAAGRPWRTAVRPASPRWPPTLPAGFPAPPPSHRRLPLSRAQGREREEHFVENAGISQTGRPGKTVRRRGKIETGALENRRSLVDAVGTIFCFC